MKPPAFWYHPATTLGDHVLSTITRPLGAIYAGQVANRIAKTEPEKIDPAVICVGNLTLGGTGKTPVTLAILEALNGRGLAAHALSRGYGGSAKGPLRVEPDRHTAADVGDEPLMLATHAPVWVSRDRAEGGRAAAQHGAQAIVMDDGHQNPQLQKDLSILVVDAEAGWGNGRVFPAGPLREPVANGLARAHAIVLMLKDKSTQPDYEKLGLADVEIPILTAWLEPVSLPPSGELYAFAGIGRPEKFFNALAAAGAKLSGTKAFPDHHAFKADELVRLRQNAASTGAQLITTEKDFARLPADKRHDILTWPVRAQFSEPARLQALLDQALDAAESRR